MQICKETIENWLIETQCSPQAADPGRMQLKVREVRASFVQHMFNFEPLVYQMTLEEFWNSEIGTIMREQEAAVGKFLSIEMFHAIGLHNPRRLILSKHEAYEAIEIGLAYFRELIEDPVCRNRVLGPMGDWITDLLE